MEYIVDPHLRLRSTNLLGVVYQRWAPNTHDKYNSGWEGWSARCQKYPESTTLPADPFYIALYINDLILDDRKPGALTNAESGIRYAHTIAGYDNPMDHKFVKTVMEGPKRLASTHCKKRQKEPITSDMMKSIIDAYRSPSNLLHHRFIVLCLLGFNGFLRISELSEIRVGDLEFDDECLKITIPKAKNDQIREGHIVFIARSNSDYCPVRWAQQYLQDTTLNSQPNSFLICRLAKTKRGHNAIGSRPLSYATVNSQFHSLISPFCEKQNSSSYGLHSLRSGGASTAINNGVSDRLVGKHGRWKSGHCRDRYLKDDKDSRLSVTKAMKL